MKIKNMLKYSGLAALVLTVAVGCASTPKEEAAAEPVMQESAASMEAQNAINEAKLAIEKATAAGVAWRDTDKLMEQAEAAMQAGDYAKATALANEARAQAEAALAQHEAEMAKMGASMGGADSYEVMRGDSLWGISGKSEVYGNPYQWPLIYKANRDKIKDADLIYPGQVFAIDRAASSADIDAAVNHAKTRGAWSLGVTEDSDTAYLAQ
jgi:nucleoid-associated protein YgaU